MLALRDAARWRRQATCPGNQRWLELARVIENLGGQVRALADVGGHEFERVTGLEQTARQIQEAVAGLAQRQGAEAGSSGEQQESNPLVGKNMILTNKPSFKR